MKWYFLAYKRQWRKHKKGNGPGVALKRGKIKKLEGCIILQYHGLGYDGGNKSKPWVNRKNPRSLSSNKRTCSDVGSQSLVVVDIEGPR